MNCGIGPLSWNNILFSNPAGCNISITVLFCSKSTTSPQICCHTTLQKLNVHCSTVRLYSMLHATVCVSDALLNAACAKRLA